MSDRPYAQPYTQVHVNHQDALRVRAILESWRFGDVKSLIRSPLTEAAIDDVLEQLPEYEEDL